MQVKVFFFQTHSDSTGISGMQLLFSHSIYIERLSLDGTRSRIIQTESNSSAVIKGVDYHYRYVLPSIIILHSFKLL